MRLIFAGTPEFAATALEALVAADHDVVLVLTQPDRPTGRGLKVESSAVKKIVQKQQLKIIQPTTLKDSAIAKIITDTRADAMIVAAYGLIIPQAILTVPRLGCLNIHASLLPRWRGAAPIQRAILAGDTHTGITIMQMDAGLDTGDMLLRQSIPISAEDTAGSLHDKLAALGAVLINKTLANSCAAIKQDTARATYAAKLTKDEARIHWNESAEIIARKIRAYNPVPGAATVLNGALFKIWRARAVHAASGAPGTVMDAASDELIVACGDGALQIAELQRAGGKRLAIEAFLAGYPVAPGARFDSLSAIDA